MRFSHCPEIMKNRQSVLNYDFFPEFMKNCQRILKALDFHIAQKS
jgi:hypothetical protein